MSLSTDIILKMRPLHDRVLVQRTDSNENTTPGGIVIPDGVKEKAQIGTIIAVGPGKIMQGGNISSMNVKIGDKIFFGKYSGTEVSEEFTILREDEILGII